MAFLGNSDYSSRAFEANIGIQFLNEVWLNWMKYLLSYELHDNQINVMPASGCVIRGNLSIQQWWDHTHKINIIIMELKQVNHNDLAYQYPDKKAQHYGNTDFIPKSCQYPSHLKQPKKTVLVETSWEEHLYHGSIRYPSLLFPLFND